MLHFGAVGARSTITFGGHLVTNRAVTRRRRDRLPGLPGVHHGFVCTSREYSTRPRGIWHASAHTWQHFRARSAGMVSPPSLKRPHSSATRDISPPPAKRKVTTTTTTKAVASFFTPLSQKEPEKQVFQTIDDSLLIAHFRDAPTISRSRPLRIAAFDFDSTLVKTKSGKRFAAGPEDWTWWHASVPGKLKRLHEEGFAVVVISNQGGIALKPDPKSKTVKNDMKSFTNFKGRVISFANAMDIPLSVYAATQKDLYRKPRTAMWERLIADYNEEVDLGSSLFVGDAAGREADKAAGRPKDHSCSDRDLAANVGIRFHTPEEFFLDESPQPFVRAFEPAEFLEKQLVTDTKPAAYVKKHDLEIVLFCGSPGAGKSTFYWEKMQPLGYARVNQDILKTREKCLRVCEDLLVNKEKGRTSVVVDNTNADVETRAIWIALAKKHNVPIRLVHFTAPAKLCEHNDTVRALSAGLMNPEKRTLLPKLAFTSFAARYRPPQLSEGFEDIVDVDFRFEGSEEQRNLWKKYWVS